MKVSSIFVAFLENTNFTKIIQVIEKLLQKFSDHLNNLFKQWKVQNNFL